MDLIPNKNKDSSGSASPTTRQSILGLGNSRGQILASKNLERIGSLIFKLSVLFLVLCLIAGGVFYFFNWQAEKEITKSKEQASAFSGELREGEAAAFRDFVREIEGFKDSLQKRIYASNIFSEVENSTVVGVLWNSLQLDVFSGSCKLSGRAENYSSVAKQAVALKNGDISAVSFDDIKLNKTGGVSFNAAFVFGSSLKQKKQDNE